MLPTLFHIPNQIGPVPFLKPQDSPYGFGVLLAVVLICGGVTLFYKYRAAGANGDFFGSLCILAAVCFAIVFVLPHLVNDVGLPIRGYGMMLLVAVVASVILGMWRARQVGANPEIILSMMFFIFVGGLVGARGLYVTQYWHDFRPETWDFAGLKTSFLAIINMTKGGLVVFGALMGAAVGFGWYVWRYKLPPLALCDIIVASLLLGQGIGRIGCLFNGCCYGGVCHAEGLPSIEFPFGAPAYQRQVTEGKRYAHGLRLKGVKNGPAVIAAVEPGSSAAAAGLERGQRIVSIAATSRPKGIRKNPDVETAYRVLFSADGRENHNRVTIKVAGLATPATWQVKPATLPVSQPVHPTQIYSAINGLVMCLFAWCYFPFRRRDGEVFALMLSIFPISRFLMEWVRTDEPATLFGMTISQRISVGLILGSIAFWYFVLRRSKESKLTPEAWKSYNAHWEAATS